MPYCPQCSTAYEEGDRFCQECGIKLPELDSLINKYKYRNSNTEGMQTGAMVLGIIGGIFALLVGLLGFSLGQLGTATGADARGGFLMIISLGIPVVGLIGAVLVKTQIQKGSVLMLISAIASFFVFGIHFLSLLPGVPLLIGGILGLASSKKASI